MPKKGLEPPRPCGHMDLNHARLPVPPLRHDLLQAGRALIILSCSNFYSTGRNIPVKHSHKDYGLCPHDASRGRSFSCYWTVMFNGVLYTLPAVSHACTTM